MLSNFCKTKTDANAELTIAPRFRMASSHGKCNQGISLTDAKRRCAAYQEKGYPAGRWRIPTKGEIEFIVQRSTGGDIPTLFDGGYWASNGQSYSSSNTNNPWSGTAGNISGNTTNYVRCVYDVWYWGDDKEDTDNPVWSDQL